jgi:hypothetical protein
MEGDKEARLAQWKAKRDEKVQDNVSRRKELGKKDNAGFGIVVADLPAKAGGSPAKAPQRDDPAAAAPHNPDAAPAAKTQKASANTPLLVKQPPRDEDSGGGCCCTVQ